jgi:A/G-specific adenine glycosylase
MDYGAMLKQKQGNPNRRSAHYVRQGPFEGSNRQVRGRILKTLVAGASLSAAEIVKKTGMERERVIMNLVDLEKEGFIRRQGRRFLI